MDHPGHLWNRHLGEDYSCLIKSTFEAICCLNISYLVLSTTSSLRHKQTAVYRIPRATKGLTPDPYCRFSASSVFPYLTPLSTLGAFPSFKLLLAPQPIDTWDLVDSSVLMGEGRCTEK